MLAKLTAALIAFGPIGILILAFIDSAGIPVASGMDALVIVVAAKAPSRALFAASMGVLGSLIGNLVLFLGARAGARRWVPGESEVEKQPRFRAWFRRYGLLTVFIPSALPIPLPLKVFVICAAAFGTPLRTFALVIALGRSIRYFGEAALGVALGEGSWQFLRAHTWHLIGAAVALFAALYLVMMWVDRRRARNLA
ncbi:MAG: VTT domain-containing protein [Bryobacteraceae bacterium]|jgi:membrane protein YqaA with SNARE-associated domain